MSLINKMLQDLDSRGTDSVGSGAMYAQIRSVPSSLKRRSPYLIWILPVALIALLTGFAAWQWMHHSGKTAEVIAAPEPTSILALKISSDLSLDQLAALAALAQVPQNDSSVAAVAVPPAATPAAEAKSESRGDPKKNSPNTSAAELAQSASVADPRPAVSAKQEKVTSDGLPVIKKQVNELTVAQRAENEYRKAVQLIQQGKPLEATTDLEQALQLDPQHVAARQTLAGVLIDAKRLDEAMRKLKEGLNLDPALPGLAMILARLQVENGELAHALESLQRTLPYASGRADYQAFLAALLQRDKRHKEAIEHYLIAVQLSPQNGVWWMGLGISLQVENRLKEAQNAFNQAKASNALSPELQSFVEQRLSQLQH